ncbi:MAG: hypothetical protein IJV15_04975 [Lachnospiraceae bacterium]|nr:hypothetical protein [Lachnospiraceae bacterium]
MAELIIIFSCFVLLPDLITVIVAFTSRKRLKTARIKEIDKYSEKLKEADLSGEAFPLNSDDGERLKQRHSRLYVFITEPITLGVFGILIINGVDNIAYVSRFQIGIFILLDIFFSSLTVYLVYRLLNQHNNWYRYTKRRGVCLELELYKIGLGAKRNQVYFATVGYIDDSDNYVVFRIQVTGEIFYALKYNKGWFVVTDSKNRNRNIITEKTLAEMVKEDKENGIERHMNNKGVYSGFYD